MLLCWWQGAQHGLVTKTGSGESRWCHDRPGPQHLLSQIQWEKAQWMKSQSFLFVFAIQGIKLRALDVNYTHSLFYVLV